MLWSTGLKSSCASVSSSKNSSRVYSSVSDELGHSDKVSFCGHTFCLSSVVRP